MGFIEKNLSSTESINFKAKLHWWVYVKSILAMAFGFILVSDFPEAGKFIIGVSAVWLVVVFIGRASSEFAITNKRVIFKTGLFSRKLVELQLNKAEGLQVEQGFIGRIFGFGSVRVTSGGVVENFSPIANPFGFKKQVNEAVEGSFGGQPITTI